MRGKWTKRVPLPGGDFAVDGFDTLVKKLLAAHPFLVHPNATRLVRAYGTDALVMLKGCDSKEDLGQSFGHGVYGKEIDWVIEKEWVRTAEDYLWRRTKMGLRFSEDQSTALEAYISKNL